MKPIAVVFGVSAVLIASASAFSHGFDFHKDKNYGKGAKDKAKGSKSPGNCETVLDDVWEEKCSTVYKDRCTKETVDQCTVVTTLECTTTNKKECKVVFKDKCKALQVPFCEVHYEERCVTVPECKTINEPQCAVVPKTVCTEVDVVVTDKGYKPGKTAYAGKGDHGKNSQHNLFDKFHGHGDKFHGHGGASKGHSIIKRHVKQVWDTLGEQTKKLHQAAGHFDFSKSVSHSLSFNKGKDKTQATPLTPVAKTCVETTEERCVDVPKEHCTDVNTCKKLPQKTCGFKPKESCVALPTQECVDVPHEECVDVPRKTCDKVEQDKCLPYPEKACEKVVVKRPREVCYPNTEPKKAKNTKH
jgi:hypothetical protein